MASKGKDQHCWESPRGYCFGRTIKLRWKLESRLLGNDLRRGFKKRLRRFGGVGVQLALSPSGESAFVRKPSLHGGSRKSVGKVEKPSIVRKGSDVAEVFTKKNRSEGVHSLTVGLP